MKRPAPRSLPLAAAALVFLAACAETPLTHTVEGGGAAFNAAGSTEQYLILGRGNQLPSDLEQVVAAAGGTLVATMPEIGVAIATGGAQFSARASRISGVESVTLDPVVEWIEPIQERGTFEVAADATEESHAFNPAAESFWNLQWAPGAVGAPAAWAAGYRGEGARVAILDGGLHTAHVDLVGRIDVARSRSFTTGAFNTDVGTFWHGTHVAGIVAASANGIGTIGVAPEATIIGVKVLHNGTGPFSGVMQGIIYAATPIAEGGAGAHIVNMSLGATINEKLKSIKGDVRELKKAMDRATTYAYQRGVTVIASAGNGGTNYDDAKELLKLPAHNAHVISVSATGPHGWALGATNFERPTYYTDHGKSLVTLSAPGGTLGLWVVDGVDQVCVRPTGIGNIAQFCETFDLIMAPSRGGAASVSTYAWAQGTSMAAPMVAGVAALIIGREGPMHPSQVLARLQQSAVDHGKPGNDEWHGMGWINAARAVGLQ